MGNPAPPHRWHVHSNIRCKQLRAKFPHRHGQSDNENKDFVIIVNKQDLDITENLELLQNRFGKEKVMPLSAKTNAGIEVFASWLKNYVYGSEGTLGDGVYVQNARQENLLRLACQSLKDASLAADAYLPYDCIVIDVRTAIDYLGEITGDTVQDEIINEIFSRFCIGK